MLTTYTCVKTSTFIAAWILWLLMCQGFCEGSTCFSDHRWHSTLFSYNWTGAGSFICQQTGHYCLRPDKVVLERNICMANMRIGHVPWVGGTSICHGLARPTRWWDSLKYVTGCLMLPIIQVCSTVKPTTVMYWLVWRACMPHTMHGQT